MATRFTLAFSNFRKALRSDWAVISNVMVDISVFIVIVFAFG